MRMMEERSEVQSAGWTVLEREGRLTTSETLILRPTNRVHGGRSFLEMQLTQTQSRPASQHKHSRSEIFCLLYLFGDDERDTFFLTIPATKKT